MCAFVQDVVQDVQDVVQDVAGDVLPLEFGIQDVRFLYKKELCIYVFFMIRSNVLYAKLECQHVSWDVLYDVLYVLYGVLYESADQSNCFGIGNRCTLRVVVCQTNKQTDRQTDR